MCRQEKTAWNFAMKLWHAARLPGANVPIQWGRHLDNTRTTMRVPKLYWIASDGRKTCGIEVDVDTGEPDATDTLSFWNLQRAAEEIVRICLFRRGILGSYRNGVKSASLVKLVSISRQRLFA